MLQSVFVCNNSNFSPERVDVLLLSLISWRRPRLCKSVSRMFWGGGEGEHLSIGTVWTVIRCALLLE